MVAGSAWVGILVIVSLVVLGIRQAVVVRARRKPDADYKRYLRNLSVWTVMDTLSEKK